MFLRYLHCFATGPHAFLSLDSCYELDPSEKMIVVLPDLQELKHVHNVETRFYCPQAFLSLDFQYRDDVSELK